MINFYFYTFQNWLVILYASIPMLVTIFFACFVLGWFYQFFISVISKEGVEKIL